MNVEGAEVTPHGCVLESYQFQRRVITEQSEILVALGFDMGGICALAETETPPRERRRLKDLYMNVTNGYLLLNLFSMKVPGPMHWFGIDTHVRLFQHLGELMQWLA